MEKNKISSNSSIMNEDLKNWVLESFDDKSSSNKKQSSFAKKKPKGKCEICGEKSSKAVCLKCGRSVCNTCCFNIIGLCKKCLNKDAVEKWQEKYPDWEKVLGVKWVD